MHPAVLITMMVLLSHDAIAGRGSPALAGWATPAAVLGAFASLGAALWIAAALAGRRMDHRPDRAGRIADRTRFAAEVARWAGVALFAAAVHALGWVGWLHNATGGVAMIPDALAVAPPLMLIAATWWIAYPIDLRLRQAAMIGQIDRGHTEPILSRGAYTRWQLRHQMALFVILFGGMLAWTQFAEHRLLRGQSSEAMAQGVTLLGAIAMLALAPVAIRIVWDVRPMPAGALRDRIDALCDAYGVRVRSLLLWRTHTGVVNAAVVGFIAPLRYILTTDGMVERLDDEQIEAVMAHELAHVRLRHLPWMLVCATAVLAAATVPVELARVAIIDAVTDPGGGESAVVVAIDAAALAVTLAAWFVAFGVVSRRIERQADAFAARHMACRRIDREYGPGVIGPTAAATVAETLRRVAVVNHIPLQRRMWRHGSIQSRIDHLHALVGLPIDGLPIDRNVRRTCALCAAILIALAATYLGVGPTI